MQTLMTDARQSVAAGVHLLDAKMPGWDRGIDLDRLDMCNGDRCVLGQLAGPDDDYVGMTRKLGIEVDDHLYGFDLGEAMLIDGTTYGELREMWAAVIESRR